MSLQARVHAVHRPDATGQPGIDGLKAGEGNCEARATSPNAGQ